MPKITYADLHADSVTECCNRGENLRDFSGQVSVEKLKKSGCAAQCFALFTEGEKAAEDFEKFLAFYYAQIAVNPHILPVERYFDIEKAEKEGKTTAILTVENMGFLNGDIYGIARLNKAGVKMASLVWNTPNALAYPNLIFKGDMPDFAARESRGLTDLGKQAVKELNANKIIVDVSHLSDGGVEDVLALSKAPVVASHSDCAAVHPVSRNLTDNQIKKIADGGGVVGLNFCHDFLCNEGESAIESLYKNYVHLVKTGGEDVPALGTDFDGIPPYRELPDCTAVQTLFEYFSRRGVSDGALEKLARKNFYRVFKEVVG
ncbi:MAG: membrane dipeptidase [Clostridia bacterium]|nr:membrane dipeptidase [Clostridia bacterium]